MREGNGAASVNGTGGMHARIQLNFAERILVLCDILLQNRQQGLGLLRAHIDTFKVGDLDLAFGLLLQSSEDKKKIPDADSYLHAISVILAVVGCAHELNIGLHRRVHSRDSLTGFCARRKPG